MTIFPFQINEVVHLYNKVSKLKPSTILEKEQGEPKDIVKISAEGKERQLLDQTGTQAPDQIRKAK